MHNVRDICGEWQMHEEEDSISTVLERTQETDGTKKLACAEAFEIAEEYETEIIGIGRICNRHNIRICKCQLGCFR